MAYLPPALQPMWSFVYPASLPRVSYDDASSLGRPGQAVQGWSQGEDGRPHMRWTVGRPSSQLS